MPRRPRRNHSPALKAKVALETIKGEQPLMAIAERFDVHPNQITKWKRQLLDGAAAVFGEDEKANGEGPIIAELHVKIGELIHMRPIRCSLGFRACENSPGVGPVAFQGQAYQLPASDSPHHEVLRRKIDTG